MADASPANVGGSQYWSMPDLKNATFNEMRKAVLSLAERGDVTAHYLMMEVLQEAFRRGAASAAAGNRECL